MSTFVWFWSDWILTKDNPYSEQLLWKQFIMFISQGKVYGISSLVSRERGRWKDECLSLFSPHFVPDIYWELHRTCLHALLSESEGGLFFSLWTKYLSKSMKISRSVANIWNYHFRVPIISTVKAKVRIVTLHEWSGLLLSLWLCFPLTNSASAPHRPSCYSPQMARYPLEWLLLKNRK